MTPQEASEELKEEFEVFKDGIDPKHWENPNKELRKIIEANTIAIEVLKQHSCEDAISRQAALEVFGLSEKSRKYGGDHSGYDILMKYEIQDILEALPSVNPHPKTGYWKRVTDKAGHLVWECDCGWQQRFATNYCPDCGAKMESEEV